MTPLPEVRPSPIAGTWYNAYADKLRASIHAYLNQGKRPEIQGEVVGLIVPHIARRLFGSDTRFSLPASMLLGGIFVILCDDICRSLLAGEIPLGIMTSLLGAAVFIGLMISRGLRIER